MASTADDEHKAAAAVVDALRAGLSAGGEDRAEAELDGLGRTLEVARRILAMREAGERHAIVQDARHPGAEAWLEQLGSSLDTLGLSVVESGKQLGIVAETAASLAAHSDATGEFGDLCSAQSRALTQVLSAMQGNAELAKQVRLQLVGLSRAASQVEQRRRLARAAEAAVVDSLEQILTALDRLTGALASAPARDDGE